MPARGKRKRRNNYYGNRGVKKQRMYRAPRGTYVVPRAIGAINMSEYKYFTSDLINSLVSPSTGWAGGEHDPATANTLFSPTEGNDINNREGRRVAIRGLRIRGIIENEDVTTVHAPKGS